MPLLAIPFPDHRSGRDRDRAVRHPLVRARLCRRACSAAGSTRAACAAATSCGRALRRREPGTTSTTSSSGWRSASCSAAGSATCCSTICRLLSRRTARDLRGLARRHVVPWRLRSARVLAILLFARARELQSGSPCSTSPPWWRRSACSSAASPTSSTASSGAARAGRALGGGLPQWRARAAPSQPALRGRPEGLCCSSCSRSRCGASASASPACSAASS